MRDYEKLVRDVAFHLGSHWKYDNCYKNGNGHFRVIDGYGRALHFRSIWNKNRLSIKGLFPSNICSVYARQNKVITVNVDRSPFSISKDIERRLIPSYLEAFQMAKIMKEDENKDQKKLKIISNLAIKITDGRLASDNVGSFTKRVYFSKGTAEFNKDGTASLSLNNIPYEDVIKILSNYKLSN